MAAVFPHKQCSSSGEIRLFLSITWRVSLLGIISNVRPDNCCIIIGQWAAFTAFIALAFSILFFDLLLPTFNLLSGKSLEFSTLLKPVNMLTLGGMVMLAGLLGGIYPALYLSKFNPITVLKGNLAKSSGNVVLRRTLVVFQFSVSMIMLICTMIVYGQLQFLRQKDLGFNKDQVLTLTADINGNVRGRIESCVSKTRMV